MKMFTRAIVSNSEMARNYKGCREKAESLGKILVLKNNQPDAVLFSIHEYEKLSPIIEYLEDLDDKGIEAFTENMIKAKKDNLPTL